MHGSIQGQVLRSLPRQSVTAPQHSAFPENREARNLWNTIHNIPCAIARAPTRLVLQDPKNGHQTNFKWKVTRKCFSSRKCRIRSIQHLIFMVFASSVKPAFIVKPTSFKDVSRLVKLMQSFAKTKELRLAIRGPGHTPFVGSANVKRGLPLTCED